MKKLIYRSILFFIVLIFIVVYYQFKKIKIPAIKAKKDDYIEKILVTGTIQGKEYSTLTSGIDGTVETIFIREGNAVKKGDLIAKLDTKEIESDVAQAQSLYDKARFDFEKNNTLDLKSAQAELDSAIIAYNTSKDELYKFEKLFQKKYVTELDYNIKKNIFKSNEANLKDAKAHLEAITEGGSINNSIFSNMRAAEHSLESLRNNLKKYYVFAPYDGYITNRSVEVGQSIGSHTPMFQISSDDDKIVSINLDEKYLSHISPNAPIKIFPYADTTKFSEGNLYYIGLSVDPSTGTAEVRGKISNKLPEFLYNSTVNVIIKGKEIKNGYLLKNTFIFPVKDKIYVYILKNKRAIQQEIEGFYVIDGFIVTKGISDGDIILLPKDLKENMVITPHFEQ